jgi:hypothetical protein
MYTSVGRFMTRLPDVTRRPTSGGEPERAPRVRVIANAAIRERVRTSDEGR